MTALGELQGGAQAFLEIEDGGGGGGQDWLGIATHHLSMLQLAQHVRRGVELAK